jgi:hypothetical protein
MAFAGITVSTVGVASGIASQLQDALILSSTPAQLTVDGDENVFIASGSALLMYNAATGMSTSVY